MWYRKRSSQQKVEGKYLKKKPKKPNHSSSCHNFGKVSFLKDHARFSIGIKVRARNNLYVTIIKINPHMHEIFLQRCCMKWVPGDPLKEMIN